MSGMAFSIILAASGLAKFTASQLRRGRFLKGDVFISRGSKLLTECQYAYHALRRVEPPAESQSLISERMYRRLLTPLK